MYVNVVYCDYAKSQEKISELSNQDLLDTLIEWEHCQLRDNLRALLRGEIMRRLEVYDAALRMNAAIDEICR